MCAKLLLVNKIKCCKETNGKDGQYCCTFWEILWSTRHILPWKAFSFYLIRAALKFTEFPWIHRGHSSMFPNTLLYLFMFCLFPSHFPWPILITKPFVRSEGVFSSWHFISRFGKHFCMLLPILLDRSGICCESVCLFIYDTDHCVMYFIISVCIKNITDDHGNDTIHCQGKAWSGLAD